MPWINCESFMRAVGQHSRRMGGAGLVPSSRESLVPSIRSTEPRGDPQLFARYSSHKAYQGLGPKNMDLKLS
jgi:hypothetical protein